MNFCLESENFPFLTNIQIQSIFDSWLKSTRQLSDPIKLYRNMKISKSKSCEKPSKSEMDRNKPKCNQVDFNELNQGWNEWGRHETTRTANPSIIGEIKGQKFCNSIHDNLLNLTKYTLIYISQQRIDGLNKIFTEIFWKFSRLRNLAKRSRGF